MKGERIPLSLPRRFICDLVREAKKIPTVPVQRRMQLGRLAGARVALDARPSWTALFMTAYARVAQQVPELRRAYIGFPRAHLYQYPLSVANVAVERDYEGEKAVFIARIKDPGSLTAAEATAALHHLQTVPIADCKDFQRALQIGGMPMPLRRLAWWLALNLPRQRGNYIGTFGVSVYSALGAESLHPICPCTTTLTYGVIDGDGEVDVRVIYDHRVLDGATVARALDALERELTGRVADELRRLSPPVLRVAV